MKLRLKEKSNAYGGKGVFLKYVGSWFDDYNNSILLLQFKKKRMLGKMGDV